MRGMQVDKRIKYIKLNVSPGISKVSCQRPYGKDWNEHRIQKGQSVILGFERERYFGIVIGVSIKMDPYEQHSEFRRDYPGEAAFEMVIDIRKMLDNGQ